MRVVTAALVAVTALVFAGCGDDGGGATTEATTSPDTATEATNSAGTATEEVTTSATELRASQEHQIEQTGNRWARLFAGARDAAACMYQTQPLCERIACKRASGATISNCTPPPSAVREYFQHATVQQVAIGQHRAVITFSNGEQVVAVGEREAGGPWLVHKIGPKAGALSD